MGSFPVSESKAQALFQKMAQFGIQESDLTESFVRSVGPGGQNVNKVSTCVMLLHKPTGTVVKCQETRSQAMNRYFARVWLIQKIENQILGKRSETAKRIFKIKKQKRKRSKRAKEKMLAAKNLHGQKKKMRSKRFGDEG